MFKNLLKLLSKFVRLHIPRPLPTGLTAFENWTKEIIELSGLPDNVSTRRATASFILQLRPSIGYIRMKVVVALLIKAAANQVALQVMKDTSETPTGSK